MEQRVLFEKLVIGQLVKKFPDSEGSLLCSQEPTNGCYSEPHKPSSHLLSLKFILISSFHLLSSPKWSVPFKFTNQNFLCISHLSRECYMTNIHEYNLITTVIITILNGEVFSGIKLAATNNTHMLLLLLLL
jgi:hypothetical protein